MAVKAEHRHRFKVKLDGTPLGGDLEAKMVMAMVEDTRNAPDLFVLSFLDPDRTGPNSVLDKTRARIGCPAEISVVSGNETSGQPLFNGEVTAIETEFDESGTHTIIRGFDKSHRLFRGTSTKAWTNKSFSDIASEIAKKAKLKVGQIDQTFPIYDHVSQFAMSDWDFLKWMAAESNREMAVGDGRFEFRKATPASDAPSVAWPTLKLKDLLRFHAMVSAADQVKEVVVRGWDYASKEAVMGKAPAAATSTKVGTTPAEIASKVGNAVFVEVNSPSDDAQHLDNVARSIAEQIGAAHAEIEFEAHGNHKLRAGTPISFAGAGKLFDGQGVITTSRHVYEPKAKVGYRTFGYVTGRQDRSLFALTGGSNGNGSDSGPLGGRRIDGVVPAIVENNNDLKGLGRVKLKFPWLDGKDGKYVSDWARVVQPGAGPDYRGWMILPEVNDEVMVAFEQGDIRYPVVLGGVYNGKYKPYGGKIPLVDPNTKEVNKRGFRSREGHRISFVESKDQSGMTIVTGDGNQGITFNQTDEHVFINATDALVEATNEIKVIAEKNVEIHANGNMSLTASGTLTLKGKTVNIN